MSFCVTAGPKRVAGLLKTAGVVSWRHCFSLTAEGQNVKSYFMIFRWQVTTDVVIHEVVETTHLRLSHGDTSGVTSFQLTTETVRSGAGEENPKTAIDTASATDSDSQLLNQMKEVRQSEDWIQVDPRHSYHQQITRHAVKGILWYKHDA
jgi:hypothetical protein